MQTLRYRWLGLALFFFLLSAVPFCFWFKLNQLKLIGPEAVSFYPISYWVESVFSGILILLAFSMSWLLFWNLIYKLQLRSLALSTFGLLPINLVWLGVPLKYAFLGVLLIKVALIVFSGLEFRVAKKKMAQHLSALVVILLVQIFSLQFVSPLNWDNPVAGIRRYESAWTMTSSPMFISNYSDAKRFEIGSFNRSLWGSGPRGVAFDSAMVSVATLLFDLPVIDNEAFVRLVLVMFFIATILGCFGFYLYLNYALKLKPEFSLIGGCFYILLNPYFSTLFTQYFPVFIAPFFFFPYCLLLFHLGSNTRRLFPFVAAGSCLALNLYFIQSHPDTVYQAYGMLVVFAFSYVCKHRTQLRFALSIVPSVLLGLVCGSVLKLAGIIEPILRHEGVMYGHQRSENFAGGLRVGWNYFIASPVRGLFLLVPLFLFGIFIENRCNEKEPSRNHLFVSFLILGIIFFLGIVPGSDGPLAWLLSKLSITSLSFGHYGRIGAYYGLVMWAIFCVAGNAIFSGMGSRKLTGNRWISFLLPGLSAGLAVTSFCLMFYKRSLLFDYYPLQLTVLFAIYFFSHFFSEFGRRQRVHFIGLLFVLAYIGSEQSLFSWTSAKKEGNPKNCKPYIALQNLLLKEKLFPEDKKASARLIEKRLKTYELDSNQKLEFGSIKAIDLAERHGSQIDNFYLNEYSCRFAPDKEQSVYGRTQFNHQLLFKNIGSPFQLLRLGITAFEHYGIGHGLHTVNFDLSPDLKFMAVFPPINALYAVPGHLFELVGSYQAKGAGNIKEESILKPEMRKMYQLAGVDIHVVDNSVLNQVLKESEIELIESGVPKGIPAPYSVVRDKNSYGLAYLASEIEYVDPKLNLLYELHPPFSKRSSEYIEAYRKNVDLLSKKLLSLRQVHSAFIDNEKKIHQTEEGSAKNSLKILSLRNNKAAFDVDCKESPCRLVYNQAALSGWRAYSNGLEQIIQKANFAFLSVAVPLGKQFVFFEYRPTGELVCQLLTLLHYAVLLSWALFHWGKLENQASP